MSPARMSLTKLSLFGNNLIISGHGETLVSDNPARDGKIANLFYSVGKKLFFLFNEKKTITEEMKCKSVR